MTHRPVVVTGHYHVMETKQMKKILMMLAIAAAVFAAIPAEAKDREPGGIAAGLVGCCFGMRTAAAWNDGKKLDLHDILDLLWVGRIWSAIEGWSGTSASELHDQSPVYY